MPVDLDRLRIPLRRSELDRIITADGALTDEEKAVRDRLADEHALDLGIPNMPRYEDMFDDLVRAYGKRFERALFHPEELVEHRWPLYARELSELLAKVSPRLECSPQTIDRLVGRELIAAPLLIGEGTERALRVFFGRHFVEVAYWRHNEFRPSVESARLAVLRSAFDRSRRIFWNGHPSVPRRPATRRPSR